MGQVVNAAELDRYNGERLNYEIVWRPSWGLGILVPAIGQANFSCDLTGQYRVASAELQTTGLAAKKLPFKNRITVAFDSSNFLMWSKSIFTDSVTVEWKVDRSQAEARLLRNDTLRGILPLDDKRPLDALSAFYLFRNMPLLVGSLFEVEVFGTDDSGRVHWAKASIQVLHQEICKYHSQGYLCWVIDIKMPSQGNLMPSDWIRVWVTADEKRLPLKVVSDVFYEGTKYPVIGFLK